MSGVKPELLFNRLMSVMYTDGALEGDRGVRGDLGNLSGAFKGVGGVYYHLPLRTPLYFGEVIDPSAHNFDRIAPIEMHAIYRALKLFGHLLRGRSLLFFVDNTHALGCLLKRSSMVQERTRRSDGGRKRDSRGHIISNPSSSGDGGDHHPYTHFRAFCRLDIGLRRTMNEQARAIWNLITELDVIVWFEYVKSKCNIADPPSRGVPLPCYAVHVRDSSRLFQDSSYQ